MDANGEVVGRSRTSLPVDYCRCHKKWKKGPVFEALPRYPTRRPRP